MDSPNSSSASEGENEDDEQKRNGHDEVEKAEEKRLFERDAVFLAEPADVHAIEDARDGRFGGGRGGRVVVVGSVSVGGFSQRGIFILRRPEKEKSRFDLYYPDT